MKDATEGHLKQAQTTAAKIISDANYEAGRIRIAAVKRAETLLETAEQQKSDVIKEAEQLKAEAVREAVRIVEEGKREWEILARRRQDINSEISRVQDVLEALESFEVQDGGIKAGTAVGAPPSGGRPPEAQSRVHTKAVVPAEATRPGGETSEEDTSAYEYELRKLADSLKQLRAERGNPSTRTIEARAKQLFGDKAVVSIATQSAAFNATYVGVDKLMWLVRTLLSWDEYGEECTPPEHRSAELDEWRARWVAITRRRPPRRRRTPGTPDPDSTPG